ncbi:MAG: DUF2272 domain-containing protein, partial [Betaproteobacteria bacterium]
LADLEEAEIPVAPTRPFPDGETLHQIDHIPYCLFRRMGGRAPDNTPPWSAAFISAVMRRAGFDETEFAFSDTHADYVVAARDHRASAYEVVPTPAAASVGDLVCATRQGRAGEPQPTLVQDIRSGQGATPMHCDLVVAVDTANRRLEAIGGNVQQSVARSLVALDGQGRVSASLNPARPWIAVMRLNKP